ncbi:MAG TPA: hypothetical protein VFH34_16090, partial [Anaerolineales bacterium]|nr:hypothetical protein [Anaerolineales bacterium]
EIVTLTLFVILAIGDIYMPDGIRMQRDHHAAIENVNLKQVPVLLPELPDVFQKTGAAKTA